MLLSLTSKDSLYDGLYLSNYASLNLTDQLARLPGVGSVSVMEPVITVCASGSIRK